MTQGIPVQLDTSQGIPVQVTNLVAKWAQFAAQNPTGTNSLTYVCMGMGSVLKFTPAITGNYFIIVTYQYINATNANKGSVEFIYDLVSNGVPANGNAVPGTATQFGPVHSLMQLGGTGSTPTHVSCFQYWLSGLTVGSQYYLDIGLESVTNATVSTVKNVNVTIEETP